MTFIPCRSHRTANPLIMLAVILVACSFWAHGQTYIAMDWQNIEGQQANWLAQRQGSPTFSVNTTLPVPGNGWQAVARQDSNGDSELDLLWRNSAGALAVWELKSGAVTNYYYIQAPHVTAEWRVVDWNDWDGDGDLDILWQHNNSTLAIWYLQNGALVSSEALSHLPFAGTDWEVVVVKDLDNDGQRDFLWQQTRDGLLAVWNMVNRFELKSSRLLNTVAAGSEWAVMGMEDFTGYGRMNLLWQHRGTQKFALWNFDNLEFTPAMAQSGGAVLLDTPVPEPGWKMWWAKPVTLWSGGSTSSSSSHFGLTLNTSNLEKQLPDLSYYPHAASQWVARLEGSSFVADWLADRNIVSRGRNAETVVRTNRRSFLFPPMPR